MIHTVKNIENMHNEYKKRTKLSMTRTFVNSPCVFELLKVTVSTKFSLTKYENKNKVVYKNVLPEN